MRAHFNMAVSPPTGISEEDFRQACVRLSVLLQHAASQAGPIQVSLSAGASHVELYDVFDFHQKMLVPMSPVPAFLDEEAHKYRKNFLDEELREFQDSYEQGDLANAGDALVDLVYVAVGTALMMGIPWASMWQRVHLKNMEKRLAKPDGSDSKRKNPLDVIKPEGWTAPVHWHDLGLKPGDAAPVFNATAAVAAVIEARKQKAPTLPPLHSFVERESQHERDPMQQDHHMDDDGPSGQP